MPTTQGLTPVQEMVLLTMWKLGGIGSNPVDERNLRIELADDPPEDLALAIQDLGVQGFIESKTKGEEKLLSLTPLGLAILRKIEEDRLQELK